MEDVTIVREAIKFKDEVLLARNEFNTNATYKDLLALAQTIQNLCIIEAGTYPNQPELGLGIENYEFELLTTRVLLDLQEKLDSQLKQFIPTNRYNIDYKVDTIENKEKKHILLLTFLVTDTYSANKVYEFNLLFGKDVNTGRIVSKLIL